jgi:hypothetical protein
LEEWAEPVGRKGQAEELGCTLQTLLPSGQKLQEYLYTHIYSTNENIAHQQVNSIYLESNPWMVLNLLGKMVPERAVMK